MRQALLPRQPAECIGDASFAAVGGDRSLNAIGRQTHGHNIRDIRSAAKKILRKMNPMASLVLLFDSVYGLYSVNCFDIFCGDEARIKKASTERRKKLRDECLSFVEKHFPASIVVDIGDTKPAKGIKVVKS